MRRAGKTLSLAHIPLLLFLILSAGGNVFSEPENIKPGIPYYADSYRYEGDIAELGEEKNYEEVFKNYEYYESIYNERKRPAVFRAYKRGKVVWQERYYYDREGEPLKKEVSKDGNPAKTIYFNKAERN